MGDFIPITSEPTASASDDGEVLLEQMLEFVGVSQSSAGERRIRDRYPINCKMQLTPINEHETPLTDDTSVIFGKDLSRSGICFSHDFPLPHRRAMLSLTDAVVGQFIVEVEITWTRQNPIGLYESGCRLVRKIAGHKISLCE